MKQSFTQNEWKSYIRQADAEENWGFESFPCSSCGKNTGSKKIKIPRGRLCADCIDSKIRDRARSVPMKRWPAERVVEILSEKTGVCDRLTILWGIDVFRMLFDEAPGAAQQAFLEAVAGNLGLVRGHVMDANIRNAALTACVELGKDILPVLLKIRQPKPWQFRANIAMAAASIDAEDERVRRLLQATAGDADPNVRKYMLHTLSKMDGGWVDELLRNFLVDSDALVREAAAAITGRRRVSAPASGKGKKAKSKPKKKQPAIRLSPLEVRLDRKFSKKDLKEVFTSYLEPVTVVDHSRWTGGAPANELLKGQMLRSLSRILENKKAFDQLLGLLPGDVGDLLDMLIWDVEEVDIQDYSELNRVRIARISDDSFGYQPTVTLDLAYFIFDVAVVFDHARPWRHSYRAVLTLDDALKKIIREHRPVPEQYNWVPVTDAALPKHIFADNQGVLGRIPVMNEFIRKGYLRTNKSGSSVLVSAIRQMHRTCGIVEFYPEEKDKTLSLLRTRLMAEFLTDMETRGAEDTDSAGILKQLFQDFWSADAYENFELRGLLIHLKGMGYADWDYDDADDDIKEIFLDILTKLPACSWISIDNVDNYIRYHQWNLDLFSRPFARRSIYCQASVVEDEDRGLSGAYRIYASGSHYNTMVRRPLIQGLFFLLGAFGLLDLAYSSPKNSRLRAEGKPYLSPWDGLSHIRLNKLGVFVLKGGEKLDAPQSFEKVKLELDEHRLLIRLDGKEPMARLAVEQVAEPVTDACYRVDFDSFLKDCTGAGDVERKIDFFKKEISRHPPRIWNEFLDAVRTRLNPVQSVELAVFRLQPNPELLRLFATDEALKKLVLKAEAYHILVEPKSIGRLKKRLRAFGYILEQS